MQVTQTQSTNESGATETAYKKMAFLPASLNKVITFFDVKKLIADLSLCTTLSMGSIGITPRLLNLDIR